MSWNEQMLRNNASKLHVVFLSGVSLCFLKLSLFTSLVYLQVFLMGNLGVL